MTDPDTLPNRPSDPLRDQVEQALATTYDLDTEIGRGGMGIVYRARDKRLQRNVAIKLLPPDLAFRDDIRSRFLREATTSAQLSHPNIVPIYTVEETGNLVFFIMGYVSGANLASYLHDNGVIPVDKVRSILREVADALAYAHKRNVIHRDIKPDNILLDDDTGRAVVTDFGIARAVLETSSTRLTTTGVAIGTPTYMSPEQSMGERDLDGRSDIYSLGVVGYQLLCGEPPFVAPNTPAMLVKHLSETPRPLTERCVVPDDLNAIIMRCLAKDPNDRFADASELVAALDGKILEGWTGRVAVAVAERGLDAQPDQGQPSAIQTQTQTLNAAVGMPQPGDVERWNATPVRQFRRRVVTFLIVHVVLTVLAILGQYDAWWVTGIWSIWLAFGYSRLWEQGYDWRDVLRQPHNALLADVVGEKIDDTKALFDSEARNRVRTRLQNVQDRTGIRTGLLASPESPIPKKSSPVSSRVVTVRNTPDASSGTIAFVPSFTAQFPSVQEASVLRNDILRMFRELPDSDREQLPDVSSSVDALFTRIEVLATTEHELSAANVPGLSEATEQEILELEAEANPFDEERSERRIRRLVQLRRQRVSLRDITSRQEVAVQKLQRCLSALRTMRLDLVRFRSGSMSVEGITQIAEQALQLGHEVDAVLYAQDEIARVLSRKS